MEPGEQIGDYIIVRLVGEGGMSMVYLAEHKDLGTQVVVKRLRHELATDAELISRFRQAATIMRELRHPNLACVIAYIEQSRDCLMVEEYLPGGSLAELIDGKKAISEQQALSWCRDVLRAVDYVHQNGVVHRDLKPGNLMLDNQGTIKVTDFGIAKAFGGPRLTRTRTEMGTPAYMSPEQIRTPAEVDHLTDVYSMGVVLYELLTGRVPFDSKSEFDIKQAVVQEPPAPPRTLNRNISRAAEQIVLRALQKRPEDRFSGCGEFALDIHRCLSNARGSGEVWKPWAWIKEHPRTAAGLFLLLMVIVAGAQSGPVIKEVFKEFFPAGKVERGTETPTIRLVAKPGMITPGQEARLEWKAQNADTVRIEPDIGEVPAIGSRRVAPTKSVSYVITAKGPGGSASEKVDIVVESAPVPVKVAPTVALLARPEKIKPGQPALIEWKAQNADEVRIEPGIGEVPATGSRTVTPSNSVSYVITAKGPRGTVSAKVDIVVEPVREPPTVELVAKPEKIKSGQPAQLEWKAQNANQVRIEPGIGEVPATGSRTVTPSNSVSYVITAKGPRGAVSAKVDIVVEPAPLSPKVAPTVALLAKPEKIMAGQPAQLEWKAQNADEVRIEPGIGEVPATGSRTVTPSNSVSYVITAKGPRGTVSAKVDIVVEAKREPPTVELVAKPEKIKSGQPAQLEWKAQNADEVRIEPGIGEVPATGSRTVTPPNSVSYVITAKGPRGTVSAKVDILVEPERVPLTLELLAMPEKIKAGQAVQLQWKAPHASQVRIEPGIGEVPATGSRTVIPTESVSYVATARGPGGTVSAKVDIVVEQKRQPSLHRSGAVTWTGQVNRNEHIIINRDGDGTVANIGDVHGSLPGAPCIIDLSDRDIAAIVEPPRKENGFNKIVLRSNKQGRISLTITWKALN